MKLRSQHTRKPSAGAGNVAAMCGMNSNPDEIEKSINSLDYILNIVPTSHKLQNYLPLLKVEGKKMISESFIKSIQETLEILDFCVEKVLKTMIEVMKMAIEE
ncbi:hypothetical protein L2E82_48238 [Cichorium intybus]|uniref:Uncharacterized protein n=1 Tax=Cichorium intybus TaxID=13427 RepID=A0ACB8YXZ2_CICIN|nr:hypothetical protein L2E82_48238 [Cichorium intybus]